MKRIITSTVLALLLMLCATPVYAGIPTLPHAFYGDVEINDSPAPDGTQVSATVDVGDIVSVQNPVSTDGDKYGVTSPYLLVQGNIQSGATITFYVEGVKTDQTATFEIGGGPTKCDLSVDIAEPKPKPPTGGGAAPAYSVQTELFGLDKAFYTNYKGEIQRTIKATSEDGNLSVTIPKDTIALNRYGKRLKSLQIAIDESPPDPPKDAHIIGLTYDFNPDGATFDPAITFTWAYDPEALPQGVAEEDLVLAYYDETTEEWAELVCEVDTKDNLITAFVSHFTIFAIIGTVVVPPEPEPVVEPEPEPVVEPEPIEPAPEPEEPVILEPEEPLVPTVPEPAGIQWGWIILMVAGTGLIIAGLVFWARKRRTDE